MDNRFEFDAPRYYDFAALLSTKSSPGLTGDAWFATQGPSGALSCRFLSVFGHLQSLQNRLTATDNNANIGPRACSAFASCGPAVL